MDGIIVVDKGQGMTSFDVVSFLRRKTGIRRIGHSGTLDPMATGVLPVFIGKATRLIEYAGRPGDDEAKVYACRMQLGLETDTQDIWGKPKDPCESEKPSPCLVVPSAEEIRQMLGSFEGAGVQRPPMYSAVKVKGRKLYEYARKGEEVPEELLKEREVYIKHIYVKDINEQAGEVSFDVHCSKGVYIRTLCADAGRLLGCGAVMSGLRRLKSDGFGIEQAVTLEEIEAGVSLLPIDAGLGWMERVDVGAGDAQSFTQGKVLNKPKDPCEPEKPSPVRVYGPEGFIGIGSLDGKGALRPKKVIEF